MNSGLKSLLTRFLLGAISVAVAHAVFGVSHAEARCGDYVFIGDRAPDHDVMRHEPSDLIVHRPVALRESRAPDERAPCSGPSCRNQRSPMEGTPTGVPQVIVRHWCCRADPANATPQSCEFWVLAEQPIQPEFFATGLFRPPKFQVAGPRTG